MRAINRTTLFLLLTFISSFTVAGIYWLLGGQGPGGIGYTIFGAFYMFIPTIAVVIIKKLIHKEEIKSDLLVSFKINKWFFVAWLAPPMVMFTTIGINLLFPNISYNPEMTGLFDRLSNIMTPDEVEQMQVAVEELPINLIWLTLIQGLIAGITINALFAFGEELGWRGFLLKAYKNLNFVKASLIIGFIWGIWHAPMILMGHNYPQHPQLGVLMMVVFCILLTPFFLYITIKSKSVIAASIMHGTMNATAGISLMAIDGGSDLISGITGFAGFITLAIYLLILLIYDTYISKDKILTNRMSKSLSSNSLNPNG